MTAHLSSQTRQLLRAPLKVRDPLPTLGRAVWLYLLLVTLANTRGFVLKTRASLARELAVPEEQIEIWLARLEQSNLIHLVSPSPYLVLSLQFWSGSEPSSSGPSLENSSRAARSHNDVPVSSMQQAAADEKNWDGGVGEGSALVAEARAVLGDADANEISALIAEYPEPIVRRALRRVKTTPAREIKKSKMALFRFLLAKFSENAHGHE